MTETKRFQLDLTEAEHAEMERLMGQAGLKTKREFVSNALTLFRWAAHELLYGRSIAAIDVTGEVVKQLEMPALAAFASAGQRFEQKLPDLLRSIDPTQPTRPAREVINEIRQRLEELATAADPAATVSVRHAPPDRFFPPGPPTREEVLAEAARGGRPAAEVLADMARSPGEPK